MVELPLVDKLICILQKCRKSKNLAYAKRLYAHICITGLQSQRTIGNYIVPMFVECGSVYDAQQIFNSLVHRNVHSWTSLIFGYIECGQSDHAFYLYQKMQEDRVHPSNYTFVALLKACARLKDLHKGRELHVEIVQKAFETDIFVGSTLVDMYAKCGSLAMAWEIFDKLPVRNVVSWNALITGYADYGFGQEVLTCFKQMQLDGVSPNAITYICVLKACGSTGERSKGQAMHKDIIQKGLERDVFVGSTLVDMYAKCGSLAEAHKIFDKLPVRGVVSWTALISGYAEHGAGQEALNCFEEMQLDGVSPDAVTFVCLLKACGIIGNIGKGREMHANVAQKGCLSHAFVGSTLVDMYAKCGSLAEAHKVFDKLPVRDVVSWNTLIAGYADRGLGQDALKCFQQMQLEGAHPDVATCVCIIKACGSIGNIGEAREMHVDIVQKGFEMDIVVGSTLVDMYAKCGYIVEAQVVLDKLAARNVVSWNALIAGYAEWRPAEETLKCFQQMQLDGISPDAVTFVNIVKACGNVGDVDKGREHHADIVLNGFETEVAVGSSLVDMYAKCGLLAEAHVVFDKLQVQDTVSWNALIAGYAEHGLIEEALKCFDNMQVEGVCPDAITFVCTLKACASIGATDKGQKIHMEIRHKGLERDIFVGNTLVDMYARCGSLEEARQIFDHLPAKDIVSWTVLIAGYAEHGPHQEALKCFEQMQAQGISPDALTLVCVLKACGSAGAVDKGHEIHSQIAQSGFERNVFLGITLIDMYASCGSLSRAREVFDKLPVQDVMSWNVMIKGYGLNYEGSMAVQCFEEMLGKGLTPDGATFACLLIACSRARMVLKGQELFNVMREGYGIVPTIEHYCCMVDLLARSGHLYEAENFLETMPGPPVWTALLSACKIYGEAELGLRCFQQLVKRSPEYGSPYVLMAKIYSNVGRLDDAYQIEDLRKCTGAKKKPASALIEVNKKVHQFVVGNYKSEEISAMLEIVNSRMKEEGHVPNVNLVLRSITDSGRKQHYVKMLKS